MVSTMESRDALAGTVANRHTAESKRSEVERLLALTAQK